MIEKIKEVYVPDLTESAIVSARYIEESITRKLFQNIIHIVFMLLNRHFLTNGAVVRLIKKYIHEVRHEVRH